MAGRRARQQDSDTEQMQATETPDPVATATDGAPEGKYGAPRTGDDVVGDYPERPYAEALSDEHAERLRADGRHPDDLAE